MKRIIKITVLGAVLLSLGLLYSCYMSSSFGKGSLSLHLTTDSSLSSPRALGDTSNNKARVWLLDANSAVFPLGQDTEYQQVVINSSGTDISIDNIPAGQYTVLISVGNIDPNGFFEVLQYGESKPFSISSGNTAEPAISLEPSPFSKYLKGINLKGVKELSSTVYAASKDILYSGTLGNIDGGTGQQVPTDYEVQSLSIGKVIATADTDEIWLNTNKGILPYNGTTFNTDLSSNLGDVTVLDSGAINVSGASLAITVFFQREGGLGGVYIIPGHNPPAANDWLNIDLSDVITGQPVLSFYITDNYAYFATKLGAFRLSSDIITTYNGTDIPDLMNYAKFFSVDDSSGEIPILSLAGYTSGADNLIMGTEKGAYTVKLTEGDADHAFTETPTLITDTEGHRITKMAAKSDGSYIAMLSEKDLFIYNSTANAVAHYPFNSGLPGTLTDLTWSGADLLVSGTEGLVSITP